MEETKYYVVQEFIQYSKYYRLKDHSSEMTDEDVYENMDLPNNYWAIMADDGDGCLYTLEDDFKSAQEAWARYDELMKGE